MPGAGCVGQGMPVQLTKCNGVVFSRMMSGHCFYDVMHVKPANVQACWQVLVQAAKWVRLGSF